MQSLKDQLAAQGVEEQREKEDKLYHLLNSYHGGETAGTDFQQQLDSIGVPLEEASEVLGIMQPHAADFDSATKAEAPKAELTAVIEKIAAENESFAELERAHNARKQELNAQRDALEAQVRTLDTSWSMSRFETPAMAFVREEICDWRNTFVHTIHETESLLNNTISSDIRKMEAQLDDMEASYPGLLSRAKKIVTGEMDAIDRNFAELREKLKKRRADASRVKEELAGKYAEDRRTNGLMNRLHQLRYERWPMPSQAYAILEELEAGKPW